MERIDLHGSFFSVPSKPSEKKSTSKKTAKAARNFIDHLKPETEEDGEIGSAQAVRQDGEAGIAEALDAVHILGEKLKKNPTFESVDQYRKAVRRFAKLIVASCYELRVSEWKPLRSGEKTKVTQIQIIDEKLEKLAVQIMRSQKDELQILRQVDEIYGLLVDLRQ
jgi:uncharacterized protein YaaR (DUF327 family)